MMKTVTATKARELIYKLIDEANESNQPIQITGKRGNAVIVSEENWRSIEEALHLLSVPGMRESIRKGLNTSIEDCSEELDW